MAAGEMIRMAVVFQEQRFEMCQCILFTKQAPDAVLAIGMAGVKLNGFQFRELLYQGFVDDEVQ